MLVTARTQNGRSPNRASVGSSDFVDVNKDQVFGQYWGRLLSATLM